jgi:hypothetical protein
VLRAIPNDRAIARSVAPHSCLRRRISRTRRIDTLSAGIGSPLVMASTSTGALPPSGRAITTPSRGGRAQIGMAEFKSESVADFIPESVSGLLRNQHSVRRIRCQRNGKERLRTGYRRLGRFPRRVDSGPSPQLPPTARCADSSDSLLRGKRIARSLFYVSATVSIRRLGKMTSDAMGRRQAPKRR